MSTYLATSRCQISWCRQHLERVTTDQCFYKGFDLLVKYRTRTRIINNANALLAYTVLVKQAIRMERIILMIVTTNHRLRNKMIIMKSWVMRALIDSVDASIDICCKEQEVGVL